MTNVTLCGSMKVACVIGVALAFNQRVLAQVETEAEIETGPQVEITGEPIVQTRPDDGTPIASSEGSNATFSTPRRLQLSGSVLAGYDDNVNTLASGSPSWYTNETAALSYKFGTLRTAMAIETGAGITYYFDHPGDRDYDPNAYLAFSLKHKVTPRLTLDLATFASYQAQPDFSTDLSANRRFGNFFRSTDSVSVKYQWTPRFFTVSKYTLGILKYESSAAAFLDRFEHTLAQEFRFLWRPTTTVVGEYRFGITDYESAPRDSTTQSLLVGLDQSFSPHLKAAVRGGVQFRSFDDNGDETSPYAEGTLEYAFGPRTSVIWTNRYSIEESDVAESLSGKTFRTGLALKYGFTPRISGSLDLHYAHGDNQGGSDSSSTRDILDIGPSIRYALTRYLTIEAGYRHIEVDSVLSSYSRNRYYAGLNLSF